MSDDDWYRATRWSPSVAEAFEARLRRAHKANRPEYLRIQGVCLSDSPRVEDQRAARALYTRAIEQATEQEDWFVLASAEGERAMLARADLDPVAEATHWRRALDAQQRAKGSFSAYSPELRLARVIAEVGWEHQLDEAETLLGAALRDRIMFRDAQFVYAQARMRLAVLRERPDLAAAYAMGALALLADNRPMAPRHPEVGLIREVPEEIGEVERVARAGDPEAAGSVVEAFRDEDGAVRWGWEIVARLHEPNATVEDQRRDPITAMPRSLRSALREAGSASLSYTELATRGPGSAKAARVVAPILIDAYVRTDDLDERAMVAAALSHPSFRRVAADQVIAWYSELIGGGILGEGAPPTKEAGARRRLKNALGQAVGRLARPEHASELAALIANPAHGKSVDWLFDGLVRGKSEAVQPLIALVDHPEVGWRALAALSKLRSERAQPVFERFAALDRPARAVTDEQQLRKAQVDISREGLVRLASARKAGKGIP